MNRKGGNTYGLTVKKGDHEQWWWVRLRSVIRLRTEGGHLSQNVARQHVSGKLNSIVGGSVVKHTLAFLTEVPCEIALLLEISFINCWLGAFHCLNHVVLEDTKSKHVIFVLLKWLT